MENQIIISQYENQNIHINSNEPQLIRLNNISSQNIDINENEIQNVNIQQGENQVILINDNGVFVSITDVLVNGVSVVSGDIAYVIVPTKISELENNVGYLTAENDPTVPTYVKQISLADINNWNNKQNALISGSTIKTINNTSLLGSGNIEITGNVYSAGTGININSSNVISNTITNYNQLEDLPDIPSKVSDLTNDEDFVSADDLADVAFSGSYTDLSNTPVIPDSTSDLINDSDFINSTDLNTALGTKQDTLVSGTNIKTINSNSILGSGDLVISGGTPTDVQINGTSIVSSNVANIITESAYNASTNKIATKNDIPSVNDGILTLQQNGTTLDTFSANASSNKTININTPTKTSDLTNDGNIDIYSTSENLIGKWIDGSNLYRRVVDISAITSSNTNIVNLSSWNISNIIKIYGFIKTVANEVFPIPMYDSASSYFVLFYNGTYLRGRCQIGSGNSISSAYAIVEYTKSS